MLIPLHYNLPMWLSYEIQPNNFCWKSIPVWRGTLCDNSISWLRLLRGFFSWVASTERQPDQLWSSHVSLWNDVWSNGRIEVRGDDELQRQINSALYYILSSLPPLSTSSEHKQFYGLSPGSLSRGGLLGEDYGGHSFWDTETWMFPSVLLFYPT